MPLSSFEIFTLSLPGLLVVVFFSFVNPLAPRRAPYQRDEFERLWASQRYPVIPEKAQDVPSEDPEIGDVECGYVQVKGSLPTYPLLLLFPTDISLSAEADSTDWDSRLRAVHQDIEEPISNPDTHPAFDSRGAKSLDLAKVTTTRGYWEATLNTDTSQTILTRVAEREVHILPESYVPDVAISIFASRPTDIRRTINPRRFLTSRDVAVVRGMWPRSIGLRMYISGFATVLFPSRKEMEASWNESWTDTIGSLQPGAEVLEDVQPSAMSCGNSARCLGLRIRLLDGTEAITALTHAFVRNPWRCWVLQVVCQRSIAAMEKISGLFSQRHPQTEACQNSPLGKPFPASSRSSSSTITKAYDTPSTTLPHPNGYIHDLSLLMGPELPRITIPRNIGTITGWADYTAALDGAPLFETRLKVSTSGEQTTKTANAIVEGTEYFWDAEGRVSAALMWRTDEADGYDPASSDDRIDSDQTASILCVGRPGKEDIKVVAFRNYTFPVRMAAGKDQAKYCSWRMRGGFVLPEEVRESDIVCAFS